MAIWDLMPEDIEIIEEHINGRIKGLYADNVILLNKNIPTTSEKACVLAEELGHHYTSVGNILDMSKVSNRKQELRARRWAIQQLIHIEDFIKAFNYGVRNKAELADYLNVTEEFIKMALDHFQNIYGLYYQKDGYFICFNPLWILKNIENIDSLRKDSM